MNRQVSMSCCFVLLAVLSMSPVDAWFMNSFAGITSDIVKNPLESLSLFALKSYLLGHVNGRVTQYRQMAYNGNRQYSQPPQQDQAASMQYRQYVQPAQVQSVPVPIQQDQTQYRQVQYAPNPTEQYYNVRAKRSVSREETVNDDDVKILDEDLEEDRQQFLEMAEKLDNNKCIPKFVCEVMAGERVTENGQFEELVAKVFGDEVPETKGEQKIFSSVYHFAAFSGKGSNGNYCRQLFPKCKASESEFKKIADKIFTGVEEDNDTANDELIEAISKM
ncbi:hypothetical protein CHUAL_010894 [Chamberlinius hualienensis]